MGSPLAHGIAVAVRAGLNAAAIVLVTALILPGIAGAQDPVPVAAPAWETICEDCFGTSHFDDKTFVSDSGDGCQSYALNVYENWNPDASAPAPAQTDIVRVRHAFDDDFWYFQTVVRAQDWAPGLAVGGSHLELAFGDCTDPATRYSLLLIHQLNSADLGAAWRSDADISLFRDSDGTVGGPTNDGPTPAAADTSDFECDDPQCTSYDMELTPAGNDAYARLHTTTGPNATIEFAIRRNATAFTAFGLPLTPCFGRGWTMETSSLGSTDFAVNDLFPTSDLTSSSFSLDNCGVLGLATMFTVFKAYSDDNMTPVDVMLSCTGVATTIDSANPTQAAPGAPAQFTVSGFTSDDTCTAVEVNDTLPAGYTKDESGCVDVGIQDTGECTITNTLNTATFTVTKTYSDANTDPVTVELTCDTGTVTPIDNTAAPGNPASFTVDGYTPGDNCTAIENPVPVGYTWSNPTDCQNVDIEDPGTCNIHNVLVGLNLAKTVDGPPTLEMDGSYTVNYTITATNLGAGAGSYDLVDTFSPGSGITLNTATATYQAGTENDQSGTLGAYPNFVTGEGLGAGLNESWAVEANFSVDPTMVSAQDRDCDPAEPVIDTGFYNAITGSASDNEPDDDDTCEGLPDPSIDLSKNVVNFVDNGGGSITVTYEITANNLGDGPGFYDVVDTIDPAAGTTIVSAVLTSYNAGSENDQSGTILGDGSTPEPFTSGDTLVTNEALAGQRDESWTIVVEFDTSDTTGNQECAGPGTGTYNEVSGSESDPNLGNNSACGDDVPRERTTFLVTKDFSDDNPAGVTVQIECNTGLPLQQSGVVHDPDSNPDPGQFTEIEFVVGDFEPGTMDCDIEEVIPDGYVPTYTAGATTGVADAIFSDETGCHYELIEGGQFTCDIFNELQPVDVVVEKEWIDENPEFLLSQVVQITLQCSDPIVDGFPCIGLTGGNGGNCAQRFIDPANPGEFEVLPHFDGTTCTATEEPIVAVLTDESDCEELILFPGQGDSCVIVNTRLFAGIPTLSQYTLLLMALLMLGFGAVAYRRFV